MENKIDEQVDISIKDDNVNEKIFTLNLQDGKIDYLTDIIKGVLKGVIIDAENYCNIKITLENFDNVVLFEQQGFYGQKYLNLRNDITFFNNEKAQGDGGEWYLNDRLKIHVEGSKYSIIKFVVRYI